MPTLDLGYTEPQLEILFPEEEKRFNVFPCGRRFGKTQGAAHACIEWACDGYPILWGDTMYGNISKYVERYFLPALDGNAVKHKWRSGRNVLEIASSYIDFRSADNPSSWEGFGYRKIVLNEAGIILGDKEGNKGPYLYSNAVLPMMADFDLSQLYAIGLPKGKLLQSGNEHPFYTLWKKVGVEPSYRGKRYSSYDNPLLSGDVLDELTKEIQAMAPGQERQEIWAEFIDAAEGHLFAFAFDKAKHVKECQYIPGRPVYVSIDFNVEPFCATLWHMFRDQQGERAWCFAEISIKSGTIDEMAQRIRALVGDITQLEVTGDRGGTSRRIGINSNVSMFDDLARIMRLSTRQLALPANPPHLQSREDYNYCLVHHPDFRISPTCTKFILDHQTVVVDDKGSIAKSDRTKASQQADMLDTGRYFVNTYLYPWYKANRKSPSPLRKLA